MVIYKCNKSKKVGLFICSLKKNDTLVRFKMKIDKKKIQKKIRRDEALEFSKSNNVKTLVFKNKKRYLRKKKHKKCLVKKLF